MNLVSTITFVATLLPLGAFAACQDGWIGIGYYVDCPGCSGGGSVLWGTGCEKLVSAEGFNWCDNLAWPAGSNVQCESTWRYANVTSVQANNKAYGNCARNQDAEKSPCDETLVSWCCEPLD